jgi:hypothetical protein
VELHGCDRQVAMFYAHHELGVSFVRNTLLVAGILVHRLDNCGDSQRGWKVCALAKQTVIPPYCEALRQPFKNSPATGCLGPLLTFAGCCCRNRDRGRFAVLQTTASVCNLSGCRM